MTHFVNLYAAPDGEQISGFHYKTREDAEREGQDGLPGHVRVALVRVVARPASGLRKGKWEDMGEGR